jgi:ankyrin repeat protein
MKKYVFILLLFTSLTPLFSNEHILNAVKNDDLEELKKLKENGENLYLKTNSNNDSLLHLAVQHSSIECIAYLLSLGMDIDYKNAMGETPFMYALKEKKQH